MMPNEKALMKLAHRLNLENCELTSICNNDKITKMIYQEIEKTAQAMNLRKRELPLQIKLVPEQWSPDNGFLTAAMKLKRKNIHKHYEGQIDQLFKIIITTQR